MTRGRMDDDTSSPIRPSYVNEPSDCFAIVSPKKIQQIQEKTNLNTHRTTTSHLRTWEAWLNSLPEGSFIAYYAILDLIIL